MRTDSKVIMKLDQTAQGTATQIDDFAGIEWYWTDEGGDKTQSKPLWKRIRLIAYKYTALWYASEELVADSAIDIANFVVDLFRRGFVWKSDQVFIQGDGAGKPQGVVYTPGVLTVNRNTANRFYFVDAIAMDNKLRPVFDGNAVWVMRKDARNYLRDQRDSNNALVLKEYYSGPQSSEAPLTNYLLGYPVLVTEKVPANGSTGDVILGNWAHYTIGNRQGFTSRISYDFKFDEDLITWRFVGRLDGIATIPEAFVMLADSAAQS